MVENRQVMAKNILHFMEVNGVNATDVCKACGFKQNTFSDWVNGKTYPRIDRIEKMANYFGISKSLLVEERTAPVFSEESKRIINDYAENGSDARHTDTVEVISEEDKLLLYRLHKVRQSTLDSINLLIEADLRES